MQIRKMQKTFWAGALLAMMTLASLAGYAQAQDKVVYHINDWHNATPAMRNISNHLDVDPKVKIIVVANANGIDFLTPGKKDDKDTLYNVAVKELVARGVKFEVCETTMRNRKMSREQFIPEAAFVPSGVVEITHLQQREGYAYLKP